ncbi:MAG: acyl-CoA dehydratase activase [Dehalococcoidia bacterium]|nr:acyl-CoA dehydratase activase [Dehalococcoidia bacterium]
MLVAGLDIGSRTIALVEWDGECILREEVIFTGTDPLGNSRKLIGGRCYDRIVATGYGRHFIANHDLAHNVITEIKAYALGARQLFPGVHTVLDIGGQDSKVISINECGNVIKFEMNDRCAAGTGRFLENMASALGLSIEELGMHALSANKSIPLSSMCTVFAESEVVSLIGRGADSHHVALGIHNAVVSRVSAVVQRVGLLPQFVFAGGVARNLCIRKLLAEELCIEVYVPDKPQIVGALGAAIQAQNDLQRG